MRRSLLSLALAGASACKATTAPATAAPAAPAPAAAVSSAPAASEGPHDRRAAERESITDLRAAEQPAPLREAGATKDDPLPACGTTNSYVMIADSECEDGSRPFDGDIPQGQGARRGNVGSNAAGHIIDLYEVPCPEGTRKIYVDMYACDDARPSRSEVERDYYIQEVFLAGDQARFAERCLAEEARGPDRVSLMLQTCLPAMPTALRELGRPRDGAAWLSRYCAGTPAPTADQPKRYYYFRNVIAALDALRRQQGQPDADREAELKRVTAEYAKLCAIDVKTYETWLKNNPD